MRNNINILLTSAGRRTYLVKYFKEYLNGNGEVHAANSSALSPTFEVADKCVVTPLIYDNNYIPFLINYCKDNEISAIISLFDIDLPVLAKHRDEFESIGTKLIISDLDFVNICNDKWQSFCYLKENGFDVPKTYIDLDESIREINNNNLSFPLIIKPRWGCGSLSIFKVNNIDELRVLYNKCREEIKDSYLKYEASQNENQSVLIQQIINGEEYGLDVINDLNCNYMNTIVRKKIGMRSGETDCAQIMNIPELKLIGKKLSYLSKHIANLDVDVLGLEGKYYVLELNARFGGGYPFSHISGVNLPGAIIEWLKGNEAPKEFFEEEYGVVGQKDISMMKLTKIKE